MQITLENVRLAFANVWEPKLNEDTGKKQYNVALLMDPSTKAGKKNIKALEKAIPAVLEESLDKKFNGKMPKKWRNPLEDGDDKEYDGYEGMLYINVKSDSRPALLGTNGKPLDLMEDRDEIYSGCYAHVSISLAAYNNKSAGVGAYLRGIMKYKDGEAFAGRTFDAETEFAGLVSDDDDEEDW